ncbi:NHS-like protein 1 isoform X1 [Xenopus laevis]|uniref:NHS-like protein 1 isoform X1 n=3 Tax=Xenopus laevis TaxID=8355 RepID=A0A8J1KN66_XENLA|nr:NHS-like protein 1 isoform X1 [Xenopus laevis]
MPFHLRLVQPVYVCRLASPYAQAPSDGISLVCNSLEDINSLSLLRIVRQLSDISRHAEDILSNIHFQASALGDRSTRLQNRISFLQHMISHLDHRRVPVPISSLDEESKWTVHYTASWHQQENVFLPSSRPLCVDDLHRQAKVNLKTVLRECDKLRRDGCRSSQYYSQGPTFSSTPSMVSTTYQEEADTLEQKFSVSSSEEGQCNSVKRPKTPVSLEFSETQTNWTKSLPLPTPEEKMCQKAHTVQTDVIPINITGETFDRQASFRRSLIHTDTVVRCPKKVKRRKTITGVPDNIQKELAGTGHTGLRWHSMLIPDHFNTLEHCHHSTQQLDTRDFSCQTDEIKIVPPSVRRIRAQKGQGIAALMSSSSGNMSTLSDSAACSSHLNGNLHFRSLPRIGARVSLQSLDQCNDNYSLMEESFNTLPWQVNRLQMDDTNVHLTNNHRSTVLQRPKSHEVKCCESEISSSPACMVSPHAAYSTSIIPNAMLSYSSELISIHTPHSSGLLDRKPTVHSSSSNRKGFTSGIADNHHSSCGNWSENSSSRSSQIHVTGSSICKIGDVPHNIPCKINIGFNNHSFDSHSQSELSYSDGHQRNASITSSINSADNWFYNSRDNHSAPTKKLSSVISGCPMSTMNSCSSKRKADSCSLYSLDQDGFSIHIDSGISLADQSQINGIEKLHYSVINMFDIKEMSDIEVKTGCNNKPLPHSISLKKSKKPPQPPSRTDSLRRLSAKVIQTNRQVLNETFIATLQQSLPLNLKCKSTGSPLQSSPCSDYADPWILHSCSQSTVSANSSGISVVAPNMYSICTVTPSQSESSSMKSEYSDQWSCFIDYCQTPTEQPKSSKHNLSSPAGLNKYNARKSSYGIRTSAPQGHTGSGKGFSSSEKTRRVASPSSGYSSQSNTPTTLTPVPLLSKNMSQVNVKYKMKPKVPERRSSLVSSVSVSSSSTSLSSNTSDSLQQSMQFSNVMLSTHALSTPPLTPDLPPSPTMDATDTGSLECSPKFPPPPLEVTMLTDHDLDLWLSCSSQNTAMSKPMDSLPYPPSPLVTMMHSMLPSPASPLITKVLNIGTEQFSLKNADCSNFLNDHSKQELLKPTVPIVTAHALQMVHLRSVKKTSQPETEQIAEYMPESCLHDEASALFIQQSLVPSASPELKSTENQTENTNYNMPAQQVLSCGFQSNAPQLTFGEIEADKAHKEHIEEFKNSAYTVNSSSHEKQSISQSTPNSFLNKNSPSVSKKPKLLLIFPPPQLDLAAEKLAQVNENVKSMPNFFETDTISELCESDENYRKKAEDIEEQTSGLVYQEQEAWFSPCKLNKNRVFILPPVPEMQNHQQKEEQQSISDELNIYINISENTSCNQNTFQDDDTAEVFNNDTANSPLWTSSDIMSNEEVTTPARPVTTEDLFARIHKSKRKVLGRKDSDDDSYRNLSSSPPVTPTGNTHLSSFKQTGSIQRSVRKTMTSSDSFKALLLKKGSRSETGFRMSAAEMLKHTDPRFQRSRSDSSLEFPESPTFPSPNKNRKVQEEWAKNEGLMPRNMSVSGIRYSRARTPPSAASSKYNVRSRLQSSPMTVICEGEGEGVETVENSFSKGPPLLNTESLDMCYNTDSEINKKDDEQVTNNIVHINLNILLEKSIEDDSGCIEEII